jgi:hypothetical protein
MKKIISFIILLIFILLPLAAQKSKDVLYLKNGSMIYGKLIEVKDNQYKIRTSDGSIFIYSGQEIEKFVNETPLFDGREKNGFGFALEAGFLIGSQNTEYPAPFSFNFLGSYTANTSNLISLGSGIEFIGKPYMPLFIEYKYSFYDRKTTPFIFARGGKLYYVGQDEGTSDTNNMYDPKDFKGGFSCALGTGISWAKDDFETCLSFAYRYAATSYVQKDYNNYDATYKNSYNRLEVKLGFRF